MNVINIHRGDPYTHYIGRPSEFANWYSHQKSKIAGVKLVASRREAIKQFEQEARANEQLMEAIKRLPANAVLGCFCKPQACHGDVIMKLWQELHGPNLFL